MLPAESAASPERLRRFQHEARAIAGLSHPNIVKVHAVEEIDGVHFIVMERVMGPSLAWAIPKRGMPLAEFLRIARSVCEAMSAAHGRGVVHRDLKPDNVMLAEIGPVKVLDFGLAKLGAELRGPEENEAETTSVTARGQVLGTAAYRWRRGRSGGSARRTWTSHRTGRRTGAISPSSPTGTGPTTSGPRISTGATSDGSRGSRCEASASSSPEPTCAGRPTGARSPTWTTRRTAGRSGPCPRGGESRVLLPGALSFDWYPDGRHLVFTAWAADGSRRRELRAVNLESGREAVLHATPAAEPAVSTAGDAVRFVSAESHMGQELYRLPLLPSSSPDGVLRAAGEPLRLTGDEELSTGEGIWHPRHGSFSHDGQAILYARDTSRGNLQVRRELPLSGLGGRAKATPSLSRGPGTAGRGATTPGAAAGDAARMESMSRAGSEAARHTVESYFALVEEGVLAGDDRVELLDGVIVAMPPQSPRHASATTRTAEALRRSLGERAVVRVQAPLIAGPAAAPEPDVAVVAPPATAYDDRHPTAALLVVEVADTSLAQDRLTKAALYAAAGVPELWIVNLREECVEALVDPDPATRRFRRASLARRGDRIRLVGFPDASVAVDELLPAPR